MTGPPLLRPIRSLLFMKTAKVRRIVPLKIRQSERQNTNPAIAQSELRQLRLDTDTEKNISRL
jgi:hypothetical protein